MRVLLFSNIRGPEPYLPLNLLSIASLLRSIGHDPVVIDGQVHRDWLERCLDVAPDCDLVGLSSYTGPSINALLVLQRELRQRGIHRPTVWGGYHGTLAHTKILEEGWADFVVRGYGEDAVRGVVEYLENGGDLAAIPNISYVDPSDGQVRSGPRRKVDFLDALPQLDYSFVDVPSYFTADRRVVQYVSSYGCPYACTFCAEPAHSGRRWRGFPVPRVVSDLFDIQGTYRPDRVSFVDPNMSSQPGRIVDLCRELIRRGSPVLINCNMRSRDVLSIAKELPLSLMREAGFRRVFIGVESGDDEQLASLRKSARASDHYTAIQALDAAGIEVQMSFIHDLPGETADQAAATIELAEALLDVTTTGTNQSHHFYMPFPGTELFESLESDDRLFASLDQQAWARTSTFRANAIWRGNSDRREWVVDQLARLHHQNPRVLPLKELARLRESRELASDYVERFLL